MTSLDSQAYLRLADLEFAVQDCNFSKTSPTGLKSDFAFGPGHAGHTRDDDVVPGMICVA